MMVLAHNQRGILMRAGWLLLTLNFLILGACGQVDPTPKQLETAQQQAEAVLDRYYEAVGKADYEGFIAGFSKRAKFYGTDATEVWGIEEFGPSIQQSFASGVGWDFDLKDRKMDISKSGDVVWFSELAHFNNTDYLLRPTGVLEREDGKWKIVQLVMGIPIPNLLYPPVLQGMQASDLGQNVELAKIGTVLDHLHTLAAAADGEAYFALFTDDATYIGTDVTERWNLDQFKAFALPYFSAGNGWVFTPRERHIVLSPMNNVAWFDEVLNSQSYGTSRGTGVLLRIKGEWKIVQYHLTIPIPNDLVDQMSAQIKAYEQP